MDEARVRFREAWLALPQPPITPYSGPFAGEARAFVGKLERGSQVYRDLHDWQREGTYDPARDPRPINELHERAVLEDWRRMGYNTAYKGSYWNYRVGRWLKAQGMLGAIDQTLWAARGAPALTVDGKPRKRYGDACGSFFAQSNVDAGVAALANLAAHHGKADLLNVAGVAVTCSWDEVGMRTRSTIDYRAEAIEEYRRYLRDVWFQDESPGRDSNRDGRTYDQFTGERLGRWDEVQPPRLSPRYYVSPKPGDEKWARPGAYKLWLDFHRYYTFEFFRRVSAAASERHPIVCYPFAHAFVIWPGINAHWGLSAYWHARLSPIVTVEQCWPESPAMSLNYALAEPLARRFNNVIMGWSWFYSGKQAEDLYDGPNDIARALARMIGHGVHGIHHWLYSPQYRSRHRGQRRQLAYWHNFLGRHYAGFLARSAPAEPQVALLAPDYTGYFYRGFSYPKADYAYTVHALTAAQVPFDVVCEELLELDPSALDGYKLLYVVGCEWTTPTIRRRIRAFLDRGGQVVVTGDSLSLDIPSGRRTDFLARTLGVRLLAKHKNPFLPSAQTAEEEEWAAKLAAWGGPLTFQGHHLHRPDALSKLWTRRGDRVVRNDAVWREVDALMADMPRAGRGGLPHYAIDMRSPPRVRYAKDLGAGDALVSYGEICTGEALRGQPVAWLAGEVCGVEAERTLWLGSRPGMSLHALAPRLSLSRPTEPANPFVARVPDDPGDMEPYVALLTYPVRKAGVRPPVAVTLHGRIPGHVEVLARHDEQGNLMVFVINHHSAGGTYDVAVSCQLPQGAMAWDLLGAKQIESPTDGRFPLALEPWGVAVLFIGTQEALEPVKQAQARLDGMDLSVPQYFLDRPALNAPPWDTPIPAE